MAAEVSGEIAMFGWFGRMLTFEVVADDGPPELGSLLEDASAGTIQTADTRLILGLAAHGNSVRDSLQALIELNGLKLYERDGRLHAAEASEPQLIADQELGCHAGSSPAARIERERAPDAALSASMAITYYDPDRDFQAGQAHTSSGRRGLRDEDRLT